MKTYIYRLFSRNKLSLFGMVMLLLVLIAPFNRFTLSGRGVFAISIGIVVPLIILGIISNLFKDFPYVKFYSDNERYVVLLFILLLTLSNLLVPEYQADKLDFNYFKYNIFVLLLFSLKLKSFDRNWLFIILYLDAIIALLLFVFYGIKYSLGIRESIIIPYTGVVLDPNVITAVFIFPLIHSISQVINKNSVFLRISYLVLAILLLYFTILSGSRTVLLAMFFSVLTYIFYKYRFSLRFVIGLIIFLFLAVISWSTILSFFPDEIVNRMNIISIIGSGGIDRFEIWIRYVQEFGFNGSFLNILFGYGQGAVIRILGFSAHNAFIEYLWELGLIGLILYVFILTKFLVLAYKKQSAYGLALMVGLLVWSSSLSANNELYFWVMLYSVYFISISENNVYFKAK